MDDIKYILAVMSYESRLLQSPIEYLKGVGPIRGELLKQEFGIATFGDLLMNFPFRYVDRSVFHKIKNSKEGDTIQFIGHFISMEESGFRISAVLISKYLLRY